MSQRRRLVVKMVRNNNIEVLSPAGDMEKLQYALWYGADAVYLALKDFGMRAGAGNFTPDDLKIAVQKAHEYGAKVYVTCNILPTNSQIDHMVEYFKSVTEARVDALIISDIGLLAAAKKYAPDIDIHISTQAGIVNYLTAQEFYNMGAKRVVLARELSLEDIKVIRDKTDPRLEIETFVHGAMCVSFSGRCLLSSYMVGRDANRGECAQPCRWGYYLMEEKRPGQYYKLVEDQSGTYILNAKDLCMIEHIDKLIDAGISSLKIEGRAKSFYYVAVVTNAYKMSVDIYKKNPSNFEVPNWILDEVTKVSHRQYSTGFYFGKPENGQYYENGGYVREYDVVATVEDSNQSFINCIQRNKFSVGDSVQIIIPGMEPEKLVIEQILDDSGNLIQSVPHPMMNFRIPNRLGKIYQKGAIIRKERA